MDFLKRLFSRGGKKEYLYGTWTTIYPTDATSRNLLNGNKEWVFISVDKVAKAFAAVRFKVMRFERNGRRREGIRPPMVDFLEAPAQDFTGKDFSYLTPPTRSSAAMRCGK